jgi:hypothetical protein
MREEKGIKSHDTELTQMGNRLHEATWTGTDDLTFEDAILVEYTNERINELSIEFGIEKWIGEQKMPIEHDGKFVTFGTVDGHSEVKEDTEIAILLELKYGYNEVDPPSSNHQVAAGSVALKQKYPQLKKVIAVVIMPRLRKIQRHPFRQFKEIEAHIANIARRCLNPDAKCRAGEWCKTGYCKAIRDCKTVAKLSNDMMEMPTTAITPKDADEIYAKALTVEKHLKKIKEECKRLTIAAGGQLGRLSVNLSRGSRMIPDLQKSYETVQDLFTVQEFMRLCTVKISDFEKEFMSRAVESGDYPTKKDAKLAFNDIVGVAYGANKTSIKLSK